MLWLGQQRPVGYREHPVPEDKEPLMKVDVRPGQLWEFTDRAGVARRAVVVRVCGPIQGVRQVILHGVGSGSPMRSTLGRLERQIEGARLVEDHDVPPPSESKPDRKVATRTEPVARRKTLVQPKMSTADRREAIATAKMLQARGRTVGEIARALSVLPEIVEGWLRDLPAVN